MASAKFSVSVSVILVLVARSTSKETCKWRSTCSCQFNNGSIVNLKPVEKGEPIPSTSDLIRDRFYIISVEFLSLGHSFIQNIPSSEERGEMAFFAAIMLVAAAGNSRLVNLNIGHFAEVSRAVTKGLMPGISPRLLQAFRFSGIPGAASRTFYWSPCTKFSERVSCQDVLSCQHTNDQNYPAGTADTTFSVDSEGNVVIAYGSSTSRDHTRQTKITLMCDPSNNGSVPPAKFTGTPSGTSTTIYTGTYISKYCCALGGSSSRLSAGSILLIIFFPLLLMYFIIGILINRYGRGIESMPELIPNYSFWADVPFLVKDGVVFTYDRIKTTCAGKCGKSGYAEI